MTAFALIVSVDGGRKDVVEVPRPFPEGKRPLGLSPTTLDSRKIENSLLQGDLSSTARTCEFHSSFFRDKGV